MTIKDLPRSRRQSEGQSPRLPVTARERGARSQKTVHVAAVPRRCNYDCIAVLRQRDDWQSFAFRHLPAQQILPVSAGPLRKETVPDHLRLGLRALAKRSKARLACQ